MSKNYLLNKFGQRDKIIHRLRSDIKEVHAIPRIINAWCYSVAFISNLRTTKLHNLTIKSN